MLAGLTITRYERANYRDVLDLIYSQFHVHTHFDWYTTERWLDYQSVPVLLAWHEGKLQGVLGAADPLGDTSWLRLIAVRDSAAIEQVLRALWEIMRVTLKPLGVKTLWMLTASDWVTEYAPLFGAEPLERIVTLRRDEHSLPPLRNTAVRIRPAEWQDLAEMTRIDHAAFIPPWQLSLSDLRQAMRLAASCTVALLEERIVGYQLSTRHRESGHLARLAVEPDLQGGGVGGALLHRLLLYFHERSVHIVTVNTQETNTRSQRLYNYYGFFRNGYDLPVWSSTL